MKTKYASPKTISAGTFNRLPQLGSRQISGEMILEIPMSNSSFSDLETYKNIAKSYGITIRLAPE